MKVSRVQALVPLWVALSLPACNANREKPEDEAKKVAVTTVQSKAITLTHPYVGRLQSHRHTEIRAPKSGYLAAVQIKEGQTVKKGDLLFQIRPVTASEKADAKNKDAMVSITAPFDGVVDRLPHPQDSPVQKGETITTLSDNSVMWVYFNVPESRYLADRAAKLDEHKDALKIELLLANGRKFDQPGQLGAIGAEFNAGQVAYRADFPNPDRLLRYGQSGTVLVNRVQKGAVVIPQRATIEGISRRYVFVVDKDNVAHRREIVIQNELDDQFVVKGVEAGDMIVVEGTRQLHDGDKVKLTDLSPQKVVASVKPIAK
jgi:membrane fusion protein (multidrug efflux system)